MPFTTAQLTAEINNDPKPMGYAPGGVLKSDYDISVLLNTVGTDSIFKAYVDIADVVAAVDMTEYGNLSAANKTFFNEVIMKTPRIKSGDLTMRNTIGAIFAAGTATRTRLVALASRNGSRAEVLWGEGTVVTADDVATALGRIGS